MRSFRRTTFDRLPITTPPVRGYRYGWIFYPMVTRPSRGVARISVWGAWCERSELDLGVWGLAPSENFKITLYSDRLYNMRDPLQ